MGRDWFARETRQVIARVQGRGGELQLQRRGAHYEVIYNGVFLMATYNGASERAAVRRGLAPHGRVPREGARVLMGGLGVGYSLQEALTFSPPVTRVVVAEIEEAVIDWNRSYLAGFNGRALADPRVTILNEPFETVLQREAAGLNGPRGGYDLVLVDTDNGSSWLSRPENAAIYSRAGLELIHRCLAPGGAAVFWCCRPEPVLERKLAQIFATPHLETVIEETGQEAGFYLCLKKDSLP